MALMIWSKQDFIFVRPTYMILIYSWGLWFWNNLWYISFKVFLLPQIWESRLFVWKSFAAFRIPSHQNQFSWFVILCNACLYGSENAIKTTSVRLIGETSQQKVTNSQLSEFLVKLYRRILASVRIHCQLLLKNYHTCFLLL